MNKIKFYLFCLILAFTLPYTYGGCGSSGGGGDGDGDGAGSNEASIQATPSEYDFGGVTPGNSVAPLEVKIKNSSTSRSVRNLGISAMALTDRDNFSLNLKGGSDPCKMVTPILEPGESCTVEVAFTPKVYASYKAQLNIDPDDNDISSVGVKLKGVSEPVTGITVRINQVESDPQCLDDVVFAYVSVTDQWGFPVVTLQEKDFKVFEDLPNALNIIDVTFISQGSISLSVAVVLDYSGSISDNNEIRSDMETGATVFVGQLRDIDEAEIIKFASKIEVIQKFTSDRDLLKKAISDPPPDIGKWTALFDAVSKAIEDTAKDGKKDRKAVIVLTDGRDVGPDNKPLSVKDENDVIQEAIANGIPLFTIGLGSNVKSDSLERMAEKTGGLFFNSPTSDNLETIYQQLAELLFENQYLVEYNSVSVAKKTAELKIEASPSPGIEGSDTREIAFCP